MEKEEVDDITGAEVDVVKQMMQKKSTMTGVENYDDKDDYNKDDEEKVDCDEEMKRRKMIM